MCASSLHTKFEEQNTTAVESPEKHTLPSVVVSALHETTFRNLRRFLPTLLIIGAWLYMMKGMGGAGGGGGGGGMSNIFKIGQSKAKKFKKEDVSVTRAATSRRIRTQFGNCVIQRCDTRVSLSRGTLFGTHIERSIDRAEKPASCAFLRRRSP